MERSATGIQAGRACLFGVHDRGLWIQMVELSEACSPSDYKGWWTLEIYQLFSLGGGWLGPVVDVKLWSQNTQAGDNEYELYWHSDNRKKQLFQHSYLLEIL